MALKEPKLIETEDKFWQPVSIIDANGNVNGVQNPTPTDGDSVYCKDIDQSRSDMGNFSGSVCDSFDDLHSIVKDITSNNPKTLFVHFNRPVVTYALGLGNAEGDNNPDAQNFSNVKIIGLNSGETETVLVDESTNNTKYTSRTFQFSPLGMNAVKFEFHTDDGVGLTNISVQKSALVTSRNLPVILYPEYALSKFLTDTGGSEDMNVDGSTTPVDFYSEAVVLSFLERSFMGLKDGLTDFTSSNFGAINGGLTNGVDIIIKSDGVELPIANWKTNYDISLTMYDFYSPFKDGAYVGRWTFSKDNGNPYAMRPGDRFIVRINDNLTGLDFFKFRVKGHL